MNIIEWFHEHWGIDPEIQLNLTYSLIALTLLYITKKVFINAVYWKVKDIRQRYYWKTTVKHTFVVVGILIIGTIWIDEARSLATFLGLLSAGLAVALKDPIVNLAGWIFILFKKPFEVGHRIQIGTHSGDIIDITSFQFTINEIGNWVESDQSTGRIIHIPNGKVFTEPVANYDQGFSHIWNEIQVVVTFESDWEKAKEILTKIMMNHTESLSKSASKVLIEASRKFLIYYNTLTPYVYTSIKERGIMLTMRYLCMPKNRRGSEHAIWEDVLREFRKFPEIIFAPTQRLTIKSYDDKTNEL